MAVLFNLYDFASVGFDRMATLDYIALRTGSPFTRVTLDPTGTRASTE